MRITSSFRLLGGVKAGSNHGAHQPGRSQAATSGERRHDQHYQVGDGAGEPPGTLSIAHSQQLDKDRDEGRGQGAARHDCEQQVR